MVSFMFVEQFLTNSLDAERHKCLMLISEALRKVLGWREFYAVSGRLWKGRQGSWHTVPRAERSIREQLQCQKIGEVTQEQQRTSAD